MNHRINTLQNKLKFKAYRRSDGKKGIRNVAIVAYLVECAAHVSKEIAYSFRNDDVHLIGFSGCYPNLYAFRIMERICTHPNAGAVLLVSLGCESFDRVGLEKAIKASGRPVKTIVIQEIGGTVKAIREGKKWIKWVLTEIRKTPRVEMDVSELIVGTICGGSDATSGITANPAVGLVFDRLAQLNARMIFEETGELIGCEQFMAERAATAELGERIIKCVQKAEVHYAVLGHGSFATGNLEGGLTTQEEKSMGAYSKSGSSKIVGILKPGDVPQSPGLYLLDVVPDGEVRFGFANINDNAEITELIACGSHLILFTTGRGSVVGSAISPVIKICANPETYKRMFDDMDVNAGKILEGKASLEDVADEIFRKVLDVASGKKSASEKLGHREFALTYKSFDEMPAILKNLNCIPK